MRRSMFISFILILLSMISWMGMMWWGWGPWGYWGPGPMFLFGALWLIFSLLIIALMIIFVAWALKRMGIIK